VDGQPGVRPAQAGLTIVELVVVLWIGAILMAITVPSFLSGVDDFRTRAAARYVSGRFFDARMEAVKQSTRVACRFEADGDDYRIGTYRDGNGNGVLSADILGGRDPELASAVRLSSLFTGVRFGIGADVPLIDGGFAVSPIRVAGGTLVTFGPDGTSSTGSVYIRGSREAQYAVRVFGITGRTRVFKYVRGTRTWNPM
jgi:prepilin-type N-terminal cleavage/methylation domain-containing protein